VLALARPPSVCNMRRTSDNSFQSVTLELGQSRGRRFVLRDSSLPFVLHVKTALLTEQVFLGNDQGSPLSLVLVRC
jgi:hypothetical protein